MAALKGLVDVLQAVPQDIAEPHERRQADAAQLQVIDSCFRSIDRSGSFVGWILTCPFSPIEKYPCPQRAISYSLGGVDRGPGVTDVVSRPSGHRLIHVATHDTRLCCCKMPALMNSGGVV